MHRYAYSLSYQPPTSLQIAREQDARIEAVIAQYNAPTSTSPTLAPSTSVPTNGSPTTPHSQPHSSQESQNSQDQEDHNDLIPPSFEGAGVSSSPISGMPPKSPRHGSIHRLVLPNPNNFSPLNSSDLEMGYHEAAELEFVAETPPEDLHSQTMDNNHVAPSQPLSSPVQNTSPVANEEVLVEPPRVPTIAELLVQVQEDSAALRAYNQIKHDHNMDQIICHKVTVDSRILHTWDRVVLRVVALEKLRWCCFCFGPCAKVKPGMKFSYDVLPGHVARPRSNRRVSRTTQDDENDGKGAAMSSLYPICTAGSVSMIPDSYDTRRQRRSKRGQRISVATRAREHFQFDDSDEELLRVATARVAAMEEECTAEEAAEARRVVAANKHKEELEAAIKRAQELEAQHKASRKRKRESNV